jgi:hydroxymethylglutaryl-CoA lyase
LSPQTPKIKIVEVGPRDGLQSVSKIISTEDKIRFINLLSEANLPEIEVTSFVSPKWIPQLVDAKEVSAKITQNESSQYTALVPNLFGLQSAIDAQYQSVAVFTTVSESFSQKNTNCSVDESLQKIKNMRHIFEQKSLRVRGYISTVWHCPYESKMDVTLLFPIIEKLLSLGIQEISLGETIGKASESEVERYLIEILKRFDVSHFALHFHDTYGYAKNNIKKAIEMGFTTFDASAGGIGGCPYAPGASGNIATESILDLCESLKLETGVHREKLELAAQFIQSILKKDIVNHG